MGVHRFFFPSSRGEARLTRSVRSSRRLESAADEACWLGWLVEDWSLNEPISDCPSLYTPLFPAGHPRERRGEGRRIADMWGGGREPWNRGGLYHPHSDVNLEFR